MSIRHYLCSFKPNTGKNLFIIVNIIHKNYKLAHIKMVRGDKTAFCCLQIEGNCTTAEMSVSEPRILYYGICIK